MQFPDNTPHPRIEPAVGIDLGTTYSLVAHLDSNGWPTCLQNACGEVLTPSAILLGEDRILIGEEAVKGGVFSPGDYADCFKRDMGRPAFHRAIRGRQVPPEVLSALLLERLKRDAERHLGPLQKAVITVPAHFDELRRKVTQDAGSLAGWEVLDIINEPIAAALCCGLDRHLFSLDQSAAANSERILVYDLGGGTFDVSLLEIEADRFQTIATDGDVRLGGRDFDERLVNYLADEFLNAYRLDPRTDVHDLFQLWQDAQAAKHALSQHESTSVICFHAGIRMRIDVRRKTFEALTQDLLERTRDTVDVLVRRAGFDWTQISRVVLSGGAVRMPMVAKMLRELTGKEPDCSLSADEAVARGAALYAGMLLGYPVVGKRRRCELINVNSHSLGVVGVDRRIRQRVNAVLIPRNTPIPAEAIRSFTTLEDGQPDVVIPVVEGESEEPDYCAALGKCVVHDLPAGLPRGTRVEVVYRYLANGRLAVTARIPSTGNSAGVEILRNHPPVTESLAMWKETLLGRCPTADDGAAAPDGKKAASLDRAQVIKRLDHHYERLGRLAVNLALPAALAASQQAAQSAADALEAATRDAAKVEARYHGALGTAEALQNWTESSRARMNHRQATNTAAFAYLVLGRECAIAGFCPPGGEIDLAEVRRLRQIYNNAS